MVRSEGGGGGVGVHGVGVEELRVWRKHGGRGAGLTADREVRASTDCSAVPEWRIVWLWPHRCGEAGGVNKITCHSASYRHEFNRIDMNLDDYVSLSIEKTNLANTQ